MKKSLRFLLACMSIFALLALAACSNSTPDSSKEKETTTKTTASGDKIMYVGIMTPPTQLNPINARELNTQILSSILFESLFDLNENFEFLPKLADSMETEDNINFTVNLNKDAKWTDGEPFTTEDVLFTLKTMANPEVTSLGLQPLSVIEGLEANGTLAAGATEIAGVKVVDEHTFTVTTKVATDINYLKEKLGVDIRFLPEHVLKDEDPVNLHQSEFMRNPNVTNGAFTFVKLEADQYVEFAANKEYYRGTPKLEKIFFKVLPSTNLVAQLQTGEVHINHPGVGPIATDDLERVKNMSNVTLLNGHALYSQVVYVNLDTVSNEKARQALVQAMNRDLIIEQVQQGLAEPSDGPYPTGHPYSNKEKVYSYDPEAAKALLEEAGRFRKSIKLCRTNRE